MTNNHMEMIENQGLLAQRRDIPISTCDLLGMLLIAPGCSSMIPRRDRKLYKKTKSMEDHEIMD